MSGQHSGTLKLDLHTHPGESTISRHPTPKIARDIVQRIQARGIDGIASTEHEAVDYGMELRDLVLAEFGGDAPLIIPGREIFEGEDEVVELYLPSGNVFRFMPHPRRPDNAATLAFPLHGMEINNALHDWELDTPRITAVAARLDLMLLKNSDAHFLSDIGRYHNEVSMTTLESLAKERPARRWR